MSEPAVQTLPPQYILNDCFSVRCNYPGLSYSQTLTFQLPSSSELLQAVRCYLKYKTMQSARFILDSISKYPPRQLELDLPRAAGQSVFVINMDELYHQVQGRPL